MALSDISSLASRGAVFATSAFLAIQAWQTNRNQRALMQHRAGLLDNESWATELATLRQQLVFAPMRVTWKMYRGNVTGEYRGFVDRLLIETQHKDVGRVGRLEGAHR